MDDTRESIEPYDAYAMLPSEQTAEYNRSYLQQEQNISRQWSQISEAHWDSGFPEENSMSNSMFNQIYDGIPVLGLSDELARGQNYITRDETWDPNSLLQFASRVGKHLPQSNLKQVTPMRLWVDPMFRSREPFLFEVSAPRFSAAMDTRMHLLDRLKFNIQLKGDDPDYVVTYSEVITDPAQQVELAAKKLFIYQSGITSPPVNVNNFVMGQYHGFFIKFMLGMESYESNSTPSIYQQVYAPFMNTFLQDSWSDDEVKRFADELNAYINRPSLSRVNYYLALQLLPNIHPSTLYYELIVELAEMLNRMCTSSNSEAAGPEIKGNSWMGSAEHVNNGKVEFNKHSRQAAKKQPGLGLESGSSKDGSTGDDGFDENNYLLKKLNAIKERRLKEKNVRQRPPSLKTNPREKKKFKRRDSDVSDLTTSDSGYVEDDESVKQISQGSPFAWEVGSANGSDITSDSLQAAMKNLKKVKKVEKVENVEKVEDVIEKPKFTHQMDWKETDINDTDVRKMVQSFANTLVQYKHFARKDAERTAELVMTRLIRQGVAANQLQAQMQAAYDQILVEEESEGNLYKTIELQLTSLGVIGGGNDLRGIYELDRNILARFLQFMSLLTASETQDYFNGLQNASNKWWTTIERQTLYGFLNQYPIYSLGLLPTGVYAYKDFMAAEERKNQTFTMYLKGILDNRGVDASGAQQFLTNTQYWQKIQSRTLADAYARQQQQ